MMMNLLSRLSLAALHKHSQIMVSLAYSCSTAKKIDQLQDWQYCKMISQDLRANKVQQAFILIQKSHQAKQILDMQIYKQMADKFVEAKAQLTSLQKLYSLYRTHFQPNILMLNWMDKLSDSKSEEFIVKLKEDYQKINQSFPVKLVKAPGRNIIKQNKEKTDIVTKSQEEVGLQILQSSQGQKQETSEDPLIIATSEKQIQSEKNPTIKHQSRRNIRSKIKQALQTGTTFGDFYKIHGEQALSELIQGSLANQQNHAFHQLLNLIRQSTNTTISNVQIQFEQPSFDHDSDELDMSRRDMLQQDETHESQSQSDLPMVPILIKSIKIGKIHFNNDKNDGKDNL